MPKTSKPAFYAVKQGRRPAIYATWAEAEAQVKGHPNAVHKKFANKTEAELYLAEEIDVKVGKARPSATKRTAPGPAVDDAPRRRVWTDGACRGNGCVGARAGSGVFWSGQRSDLSERLPGRLQTNQRAELYAIVRALQTDPTPNEPLEINTDSQYSINCLTVWLPAWRRSGWKSSTSGKEVVNKDLILAVLALIAQREVAPRFKHVRAHQANGDPGNAAADRLAVGGAYLDAIDSMPNLPAETEVDPMIDVDDDGLADMMLSPEELAELEHEL